MGRVIVFGSLSQDLHLPMQRHPRTGETVMSGDIEYRFGGKGANQAVAAARAGVGSVFVGKVGDDPQGREYVERLRIFGVDTSQMEIVEDAPTGTAIIYNDKDGENMIVVAPGANHRMGMADLDRLDDLTGEDVLLMPLELPLDVVAAAAWRGHERGARVMLNLAPFAELPADVLALCDPVVVNEHEADLLAQAGLEVPELLTTLGAEGARWGDLTVPATPVTPVDTTGAGDAFCGTLAAALCRGADRAAALAEAAEAASANVLHHGAQPPLPAE
ncbi:ribokinase [Ornithinicoccus hortensis]|uniref:Ribokinase n=1 Tax=Ornithinicoccus hortensis TaxID=82346 RepID=A0A542YLM9_9MICO|nr:ribokinase [Ornithinicoccus hortensis]TQL49006.1 ribokinase [Ornithinicoccus hortensis]